MPDITAKPRTPRVDMVRSMLARRDGRTPLGAGNGRSAIEPSSSDRGRLWQERLSRYVRDTERS